MTSIESLFVLPPAAITEKTLVIVNNALAAKCEFSSIGRCVLNIGLVEFGVVRVDHDEIRRLIIRGAVEIFAEQMRSVFQLDHGAPAMVFGCAITKT